MKTAADVYAPVNGEITQKNDKLTSDPALVNTSAEKDGWLFKVKVNDEKDLGMKN